MRSDEMMKTLFLCHEPTTLLRLRSARTAAGAAILKRTSSDTQDCIVTDIDRREARRLKFAD
jgi:hypothetical protein